MSNALLPCKSTKEITFAKLSVPNTGQCLFNLSVLSGQQHANGLLLFNLNDILFFNGWLKSKLATISSCRTPTLSGPAPDITPWLPMLKRIRSQDIVCVFYLDISQFLKADTNIEIIRSLASQIFQELGLDTQHWGYLVALQKDAFQLRCFGPKSFLIGQITAMVRYMSRDFHSNIYLAGHIHPLCLAKLENYRNTNFLAVLAYNYVFLDLHIATWNNLIPENLPMPIAYNFYPVEYITLSTRLKFNKQHLLSQLKESRVQIKKAIHKAIVLEPGVNNYVIGLNLDGFFDIQMVNGIKSIFRELKQDVGNGAQKQGYGNSSSGGNDIFNSFGSLFSGGQQQDDTTTVEVKVIGVVPGEESLTDSLLKSLGQSFGMAKPTGFTINYIPLILPANSAKLDIKRLSNILDSLTVYSEKTPTIWVFMSAQLTFDGFRTIVNQLVNTKAVPGVKLRAHYLDMNMNRYLRTSLAYYNYLSKISNGAGIFGINRITDTQATERAFYKYIKTIRKTNTTISTVNTPNTAKDLFSYYSYKEANLPEPKAEDCQTCCTCCKCMARHGIKYTELKHLPYLDDVVIKLLEMTTDIWIPRI
jgi:hypothetical protein